MRTFVGLHIPKCAGTSFLDMARDVLPAHQLFQNTSIIMNWNDGRPEFLGRAGCSTSLGSVSER